MNNTLSFLEWLSTIGSVASIVGIGLSIYVIYNLRQIRRSYIFTARAPHLLKSLGAHSSSIRKLLDEFDTSKNEIETELAQCSAVLESLLNKVGRNEGRSISKLIKLIADNKNLTYQPKDVVWNIFRELTGVRETLRNLQKDKQWEK